MGWLLPAWLLRLAARRRESGCRAGAREQWMSPGALVADHLAAACARSDWARDDDRPRCRACGVGFGLFTRRHHCRCCGDVFCDGCTPHLLDLREKGSDTELRAQRACGGCMSDAVAVAAQALPADAEVGKQAGDPSSLPSADHPLLLEPWEITSPKAHDNKNDKRYALFHTRPCLFAIHTPYGNAYTLRMRPVTLCRPSQLSVHFL